MTRGKISPGAAGNSVADLLRQAVELHVAGRIDEAEQRYDKILHSSPRNADALNLKGVIAGGRGHHADAVLLFDRALAQLPSFAQAHFNRANALAALGRNDEALSGFAQAIRLSPPYPEARLNAGALFHKLGRLGDAVNAFRAVTAASPGEARGHYNLGASLTAWSASVPLDQQESVLAEAAEAFRRALALNPKSAEIHFAASKLHSARGDTAAAIMHLQTALALPSDMTGLHRAEHLSNLGELLRNNGQPAEAVATQRTALAARPDDKTIIYNLALALGANRETDEAAELYRTLITRFPEFARPYVNLANIYRDQDQADAALRLLEDALFIDPGIYEAYANIAANFADRGWLSAASLIYKKSRTLKPDDAAARADSSITLLRMGRLSEGWRHYDSRFDDPKRRLYRRPEPPVYWQGQDIAGKTLLIWTEQGLGDEILHCSMIDDVVAAGGRCVIECSKRLVPVFARSFPGATIAGWTESHRAVTPPAGVDYQVAAGNLGKYFRPDFTRFPRRGGYLKADPEATATFRSKYLALAGGRRIVGLAWRSKHETIGADKSTALLKLAPILRTENTYFVNLQYGDCAAEIAAVRSELGVDIFQDPDVDSLTSIDDFFAQTAAMDLVISTSNTAAHVAGAQNVPVWILLPHAKGALWYWFTRRLDSPWYPSARLYRSRAGVAHENWEREPCLRAAEDLSRGAGSPSGMRHAADG